VADPIEKAQLIRAADVALLGPAIWLGGTLLYPRRPLLGGLLVVTGVGTILYNLKNLVEQADQPRG